MMRQVLYCLSVCLTLHSVAVFAQKSFPDPPNDLTRVYYSTTNKQLVPLPFESGSSPLNVFVPAKKDRVVRVKVKGPSATTVLTAGDVRFYVFVGDKMDPPPHQLVRLTTRDSVRELAISVIQGRKGYAPFDNENVRIEHRLLERLQVNVGAGRIIFVHYIEIRPRESLAPGEYAIIGDSLADMATFRVQ